MICVLKKEGAGGCEMRACGWCKVGTCGGVHVLCVFFFLFWWVLEIGGGRVGGGVGFGFGVVAT